jgi:hypothetical protein
MNIKHPPGPPMTLGNMRALGVHRLVAYCLNILAALVWTSAFAFSPADCGVTDTLGPPRLQRYCATLRQQAIASDPGNGLIGKLDKADPISGEPASQRYYWIVTPDGQTYFDGSSDIGRKILKVCRVGRLCAVKVGVEKSWEHNVDHATFWITKIIGEPIGE